MKRARFRHLLMTVAAMATMSACAEQRDAADARDITVRPRVVVDGTVELGDRTDGRVLLSSITAHANDARVVVDTIGGAGIVVVDDQDPLFFSYAPTQPDAQQAAERVWRLPVGGGALHVGFSPADSDALDVAPFDASALEGHTVVISGTIAIASNETGLNGFGAGDDLVRDETVSEIDPDGTPATDPNAEVDPDGTPARPTNGANAVDPDGTPADVDPDGTPADVDPDGTPADVDPDGTPADVDPDGTPADVDPDGTPARGKGDTRIGRIGRHFKGTKARATMTGSLAGRPEVRVPFTLTVDGAFEYEALLTAEAIAAVDDGEVLPIDMHFAAAAFFDAARLAVLEGLAAEAVRTGDEEGASLAVSAASTAKVVDVEVNRGIKAVKAVPKTSSKIVVTGPTTR